jgi:aminoglycoside phosphotransferase (APT) family kinase protein
MGKKGTAMLREPTLASSPALYPAGPPPAVPLAASPSGIVPAHRLDVARALVSYFRQRLGGRDLALVQGPDEVTTGWETYIYRFRLRGDALPTALNRPLVVRLYHGPGGIPRACREFAVLSHVYRAGHAVPEPVLIEADCRYLGGPFLVMEDVPGETLVDRLRHHNTYVFGIALYLAALHRQLHRAPVGDFPALPGPFLQRHLDEIHGLIRDYGLRGLSAGLDWLHAHRPAEPERPALVHLDFHPMNVLLRKGRPPVVLDWGECDVGDRHADLATTVLLIHSTPVPNHGIEWVLDPFARRALIRGYLFGYGRHLPLDRPTLRYYLAWAALRRLAVFGMWLVAGPPSNGCKPCSLSRLRTGHLDILRECFRHWAGVDVEV